MVSKFDVIPLVSGDDCFVIIPDFQDSTYPIKTLSKNGIISDRGISHLWTADEIMSLRYPNPFYILNFSSGLHITSTQPIEAPDNDEDYFSATVWDAGRQFGLIHTGQHAFGGLLYVHKILCDNFSYSIKKENSNYRIFKLSNRVFV